MRTMTIDLQEGFMDDNVVIQVDDVEVYNKDKVSTGFVLARADSLAVELPEGPATVRVMVPSKRLSGAIVLDVTPDVQLGVALVNDEIKFRVSDKLFPYF
jgi:hypothetical protein